MPRREFPAKVKAAAFQRADGRCEKCGARLYVGKFHFDHRIPDALGGEPTLANCEVLCTACHGEKTATKDAPTLAKTKRIARRHLGIRKAASFPGGRGSKWKRTVDGRTVLR